MKKQIVYVVIIVAGFLLPACATVKIYSDSDLKTETGLRYYTLKPYLLVEYQAEKDNSVKTTVVYLPDLASPQYMMLKAGIGSNNVKMDFVNSALESYGSVSESQFPEAMEAFAAMLSKSAYAAQPFTGPQTTVADDSTISFKLFEIIVGAGGTALKEVMPVQQNSQIPLP